MSAEVYRRAKEIVPEAAMMTGAARAEFLARVCEGNAALRDEVESLLGFLQTRGDPFDENLTCSPALFLDAAGSDAAPRRLGEPARLPERVGPYRIVRLLGAGGMGLVYEAEQSHPRRRIALKLLNPGLLSAQTARRFEHEAEMLAQLQHPGIAHVYDAGTAEVVGLGGAPASQPFFAMELIRGEPLTEYAARHKLDTSARLRLLSRICEAVEHAHQKGVIHRDLKPANILVNESGQPKVLDFGVARATNADVNTATMQTGIGQLIGTLPYMSPEQVSGDPRQVDTRSDVYALGVVLYELLTGRPAFDVREISIPDAVRRIQEEEPPRPSSVLRVLRGDIETIVATAMSKDRSRRYQSTAALADDIGRYLNREPIAARPASAIYQMRKFAQRHRALVGGVVATFLALIAGVVGTGLGLIRADQRRSEAVSAQEQEAHQHKIAQEQAVLAQKREKETEHVAEFTEEVLSGVSPFVSLGRDTTLLKEMMGSAARRIKGGELADAPQAELRLRLMIGNTLREINARDAAGEMLESALELARATHAGDHPDTARALSYVAWLRLDSGDAEAALPLAEDSLAMRRRLFPADHTDVATSLNNVAAAYLALGRFPEALAYQQDALAIEQRLSTADHRELADYLNNVAHNFQNLGRLAEALPMHRQALAMFQRLYDGDHPMIAITMNNLAGCLRSLGRPAEALPMFEDALSMRRRLSADDDPSVANMINNVAACLRDMGRAAEALPRHEDAVAMYRRLYPGDHPKLATSLNSLGLCHYVLGQGEKALEYYEESLQMRQRLLDGDHPDLAISLGNVGSALAALHRFDEARVSHEAAVSMQRRLFKGDHLNVAISLHNLADCLDSAGRPQDALAPYEEALSMRRRILPADHLEVIHGAIRLGSVLTKLGRLEEAEPLLVDGAERLTRAPHAPAKLKRVASESLQRLYEARHAAEPDQGFDQKALEWRDKLEIQAAKP